MTTIADVAFDVPLAHSFTYRVPDGWTLAPGQRVVAPLRGASRVGMVVTLRDGADARLKALDRIVDGEPMLSPAHLDLVHWIAAQSLSSVGSTCAAGDRHAVGPAGTARRPRHRRPDRRARGGPQAAGPAAHPLARRRVRARRARAVHAASDIGHAEPRGLAARRVGAGGHGRAAA